MNDVLQVSKLESGRLAETEESFDLHDALADCITILYAQAEENGICRRSWDIRERNSLFAEFACLTRSKSSIMDCSCFFLATMVSVMSWWYPFRQIPGFLKKAEPGGYPGRSQNRHLDDRAGGRLPAKNVR